MYCKKCGKEIPDDTNFCPECGAQEGAQAAPQAEAAPQTGNVPPASGQQPINNTAQDFAQSDNIAILSYFGILFLIPYFARPDSKFCKFHCNQGLLMFIAVIVFNVVVQILSTILGYGVLRMILVTPLNLVGGLGSIALLIIGIKNVLDGKMKELPLIGSLGITIIK